MTLYKENFKSLAMGDLKVDITAALAARSVLSKSKKLEWIRILDAPKRLAQSLLRSTWNSSIIQLLEQATFTVQDGYMTLYKENFKSLAMGDLKWT